MTQVKPDDLAQTIEIYQKDGEWKFRDCSRNLEDMPFSKDSRLYRESDLHKFESPYALTFSRRPLAFNHCKFAEKQKAEGGYYFRNQYTGHEPMWFSNEFIALFDREPARIFFRFEQIAEATREWERSHNLVDYDFDPDDETDADSIESDQTDEWSASLKEMTREILYEMPIANFHMGYCMLKSLDDQYGLITIGDVSADRYIIRNTENKSEISRFDSIDELLKAGWVID